MTRPLAGLPAWKLEDAKARFSELVRRTRREGPQRVTLHGKDAVVVLAAEDFAAGQPSAPQPDLATLLAGSPLTRLELEPGTERSPVRDVEL